MDNKDNIGRKMDDKYLVNTTSGSTGNPAVVLYDETTMNVVSAIAVLRSFARAEDMKKFLKKGKKKVRGGRDKGKFPLSLCEIALCGETVNGNLCE